MTEQFGFDQSLWNGAAADRNKRPSGTRAKIVDRSRNQFFAGAAFAGDENRGIEISNAMHKIIDVLHLQG